MSQLRVVPILVYGLILAGSAEAVTFSDEQFDPADWSVAILFANDAGQVTSHSATGGNPGAYRFTEHTLAPGQGEVAVIFVFHEYTAGTFDPSIQGELVSIDYAVDTIEFNPPFPGAAISHRLALMQDGVVYQKHYQDFTNLVWQSGSLNGLVESDFLDLLSDPGLGGDGIFENPDFSPSGAPIRFGYIAANSGGGTVTTEHGIDNWSVTLASTQSVPALGLPAASVLALLLVGSASLALARRGARQRAPDTAPQRTPRSSL